MERLRGCRALFSCAPTQPKEGFLESGTPNHDAVLHIPAYPPPDVLKRTKKGKRKDWPGPQFRKRSLTFWARCHSGSKSLSRFSVCFFSTGFLLSFLVYLSCQNINMTKRDTGCPLADCLGSWVSCWGYRYRYRVIECF